MLGQQLKNPPRSATDIDRAVAGAQTDLIQHRRRAVGSQPVERGLQDRLKVAGVAVDLGDRDDHVEHLLEVQVTPDFVGTLGREKQGSTGGEHAAAAFVEERFAVVGLLEQFGADVALAVIEREEPV